ncbi:MAG: RNA methyltransferase [Patescibacteria group bacterium]
MTISSPDNPQIKLIQKLNKKKSERDSRQLFIVEGIREIKRAMTCHIHIDSLYFSGQPQLTTLKKIIPQEISTSLFQKISYRQNSSGCLAIFRQPSTNLKNIKFSPQPFILVIESPEKPGNVGALLRTADAALVDAIIITNPQVDLFNPNVIRSACGTFFSRPVYLASTDQTIQLLQRHSIKIIATTPAAPQLYYDINYQQPIAIIAGREDTGLSPAWLAAADHQIKLPMQGIADSLNLSVATGIILYEALKQRNNK